jgi:hypothetical protein
VTLQVAPGGYLLAADEGEALSFPGALLTYKTTAEQTTGSLAVAEVHAPRGVRGRPLTGITARTRRGTSSTAS